MAYRPGPASARISEIITRGLRFTHRYAVRGRMIRPLYPFRSHSRSSVVTSPGRSNGERCPQERNR